LLLPGGIAPLTEERDTDENGEVQFANSHNCTYRLQASGYKDVEIDQLWLRMRSFGAEHLVGVPSEEATIYKVAMQPLDQ
jgi:hypothetical protein